MLSFLLGVTPYEYRKVLPFSRILRFLCLAAFVVLNFAPYGNTILIVPAAYMTAHLSVSNFPKTLLVKTGDYSYGI